MPTLNIKDPEVYEIASELARRTGASLTEVVRDSLRNTLAANNNASRTDQSRKLARVMEIARRISSRPVLDPRTPDEILGYDDHGVPT
jgi:antitoxin VapB